MMGLMPLRFHPVRGPSRFDSVPDAPTGHRMQEGFPHPMKMELMMERMKYTTINITSFSNTQDSQLFS